MRNPFFTAVFVFLSLCLLPSDMAFGEENARSEAKNHPNVWRPCTKSVAIFKNGLGFFTQEGTVALHDGWCRGASVPPASFGTFAVYSLDAGTAVDTIALGPGEILKFDGQERPDTPDARRDALKQCLGLNLLITYSLAGTETDVAGTLKGMSEEYVILSAAAAQTAVPLSDIRKIQILDLPLRVHVGRAEDSAENPEKSADENENVTLGMSYLRKGIMWVPEYTLTVLDDENAELTLRGTIINEAEDLIGTDVHLVVGVPHFIHSENISPLVAGQAVRTLGVNLAAATNSQIPQQMMTQQMMNSAPEVSRAANIPSVPVTEVPAVSPTNVQQVLGDIPATDTAGASDYTVYTRKNLTLRRGERAMLTLFSWKIKYSHIYRWNVGEHMTHALRIHNETPTAWTTGPCIAISGSQALTEDTLKYTPKNSIGELALTESINIGQEHRQNETSRKISEQNLHGRSFDCVQLAGAVVVRNFEPRDAEIIISVPVEGKALTADQDGAILQDAGDLRLTSRKSSVTWKVKLPPGGTQELKYTYERYVESL